MRLRIALLTFMAYSTAYADDKPTQKEQALQTVKDYALSTACNTTFEKTKYNNFGNPDHKQYSISYTTTADVYQGINNYYVLWGGYDSCSIGATGQNYTYRITEVAYSEYANRYIIQDNNLINDVKDEPFFNIANIKSLEQIDYSTFKVSLYMFQESDIEPLTDNIKKTAKPIFYTLTLVPDHATEFGYTFKVTDKSGIKY